MKTPSNFTILSCTCHTAKHPDIQSVINNLRISELVHCDESDPEVNRYVHTRTVELLKVCMNRTLVAHTQFLCSVKEDCLIVSVQVPVGSDTDQVNDMLLDVIRPYLVQLRAARVIDNRDAANVCFPFSLIHQSSCLHAFTSDYELNHCFLVICCSCTHLVTSDLLLMCIINWLPIVASGAHINCLF